MVRCAEGSPESLPHIPFSPPPPWVRAQMWHHVGSGDKPSRTFLRTQDAGGRNSPSPTVAALLLLLTSRLCARVLELLKPSATDTRCCRTAEMFCLNSSGGYTSKVKVLPGPAPSEPVGEPFCAFPSSWWFAGALWVLLSLHRPHSTLCPHGASRLCLCLHGPFSYRVSFVRERGPTLLLFDPFLTEHICSDPVSR